MVNNVNSAVFIQWVFAVDHYLVANFESFSYLYAALQISDP